MTAEQFATETSRILSPLPPEFRGFVAGYAWEHGHSSGYDEVLLITRALTDDLLGPIHAYSVRIGQGACASAADELRWRELADTSYQGDY